MATRNRKPAAGNGQTPQLTDFSLGIDFDASHDFDTEPVVEGVVEAVDYLLVNRRGKRVPVGCMTLRTKAGTEAVWESKKLEKLIQAAEPGWYVRIEYLGKVDLGSGQSMRDFRVQVSQGAEVKQEIISQRVTAKMRAAQQAEQPEFNDDVPF